MIGNILPYLEYNLVGESMSKVNILDKQKFILAKLLLLPNKLQAQGDQIFAGEMTLRQWLLTVAVAQYGDTSLTLSKAAELMGSSHQNVKQLALKLAKGGFLNIRKDENDLRASYLTLTEKSYTFWKKRQEEIRQYLVELFKDLSKEEITILYDCINKLYERILKLERVFTEYERVFK